jgi:hypothetical protein
MSLELLSLELHEWDIHIVCFGTDGASGAGGAAAHDPPRQAGTFRHRDLRRTCGHDVLGGLDLAVAHAAARLVSRPAAG